MENTKLTQNQLEEYFQYIGREVHIDRVPANAGYMLRINRSDATKGHRYSKRVWSHLNVNNYLRVQSENCAELVQNIFATNWQAISNTYRLTNPHGNRFQSLGIVHFRKPNDFSEMLSNQIQANDLVPNIAIERIELHASIRGLGFLNMLAKELETIGLKLLVLQSVFNPSFAYHLHQKSLNQKSNILLLSSKSSVDFENRINPGPSFGWRLGC